MFFATQHCTRSPLFGGQSARQGRGFGTKLNLVSLMDIFTILVFFLMVNSGDVEILQPDENVVLPKSYAKMRPDESPVIKISDSTLIYKENAVVSLTDIDKTKELIEPLYQALMAAKDNHSKNNVSLAAGGNDSKAATVISIMGSANVPYKVLKKVLYTCAQAGYSDVALAVEYAPATVANDGAVSIGSTNSAAGASS